MNTLLRGGGHINGVGQNSEGEAYVTLVVNGDSDKSRRFGVVAVAKDGRELTSSGGMISSFGETGGLIFNFNFGIPLADVAKFIIGTRPIRTCEWKDVVLPGDNRPPRQ